MEGVIKDGTTVEVALQYNDTYQENIFTFANNIHTPEGGTHLAGFSLRADPQSSTNMAASSASSRPATPTSTSEDVREGLTAVISVKLVEPQFEGQTKTKLGNSEVRGIVDGLVYDRLSTFLERKSRPIARIDPGQAALRRAARPRGGAQGPRPDPAQDRAGISACLPGKLADCTERDPEQVRNLPRRGRLAPAAAPRTGRDRYFQAILPLRGKILNVEKARIDQRAVQRRDQGHDHRLRLPASARSSTSKSCATTASSA